MHFVHELGSSKALVDEGFVMILVSNRKTISNELHMRYFEESHATYCAWRQVGLYQMEIGWRIFAKAANITIT